MRLTNCSSKRWRRQCRAKLVGRRWCLKSLPRKRSRNEIEATAELQQSRMPASVVGISDASGDLLWESEMRLRRDKAGYAVGRPRWRSSFLGDPGAKFLCGN